MKAKTRGRVAIKTRAEFLSALGDEEKVRALIEKLQASAVSGDLPASKYVLDQLYGAPKTTVVTEIGNRDLFARIVRVTAGHLRGQEFEAWLSQVRSELSGESSELPT